MIAKFQAARRAAVPLVAIETADPRATMELIKLNLGTGVPAVQWDIIRGLSGANPAGADLANKLCKGENPSLISQNPAEMLPLLEGATDRSVIFMHQANRLLESSDDGLSLPTIQGIWNLRDILKTRGATLVLLGPSFRLPMSLKNDVMVISEPLPGTEELKGVVKVTAGDAQLELQEGQALAFAKTLTGLSAFAAEQSFATSIVNVRGELQVDTEILWDKKCKAAEQTKGITIHRGEESYENVVGYENVKWFLKQIMTGPDPVEVYVFMDEIEKMFAGFGTDLSGVTGEMMGKMLTWMQDAEALGVLLIGGPGTGKSLVGKSTGKEAKKPTVIFDVSGMKGSLIGESVAAISEAHKMVSAMSGGGKVMVLATCNRVGALPPELRRRFSLGTFFFDLPTGEERSALWAYYTTQFKLKPEQVTKVYDDGWTGAEIKNCCNIAWRLSCKLSEAANYIVPVCQAAGDEIEKLRNMANGKFISASAQGIYHKAMGTESGGRKGAWFTQEEKEEEGGEKDAV